MPAGSLSLTMETSEMLEPIPQDMRGELERCVDFMSGPINWKIAPLTIDAYEEIGGKKVRRIEVGCWYWCHCQGNTRAVRVTSFNDERLTSVDQDGSVIWWHRSDVIGPCADSDIPRSMMQKLASIPWIELAAIIALGVLLYRELLASHG